MLVLHNRGVHRVQISAGSLFASALDGDNHRSWRALPCLALRVRGRLANMTVEKYTHPYHRQRLTARYVTSDCLSGLKIFLLMGPQ